MPADVRRDDGFTLIELMTVIVILGILAAVALPSLLSQKEKAAKAAAMSDLRSIRTAQSALLAEDGNTGYTEQIADLESVGYNRSDGIEPPVIRVNGGEYVACVKHQSVSDWLVLDSTTQEMSWDADDSACA